MSEITACPSCDKQSRVPSGATGKRPAAKGIPTLLLFDDGKLTARQTGALPAHALTEWLDAHAPAAA